ncbi:MAG: ThuA domain-containing protein [Clostridia bacterium]|nr:ThuA domain-containing protein [Clostridia bacterium]
MSDKIRVTFWHECRHEKTNPTVTKIYPGGIHAFICNFLNEEADVEAKFVTLDDPDQGLPDEVLNNTDVLIWWGHLAHGEVKDELVEKVFRRVVNGGMGILCLHSAHHSKPFKRILGSTGNLTWGRNQREVIWNMNPAHPILAGIPDHFIIDNEELYAEPFYIPQPDELLLCGWFEDGHVFRSGACYHKGAGKLVYLQPGHETCRSFHNPYVQRLINNAVHYLKPNEFGYTVDEGCIHVTEPIVNEFNK